MARTRAAGHNDAYRPVPGAETPGEAGRSSPNRGSRHVFGVVAVAAVFALVGLTLWRPLSALIAVPLIAVLALIVRATVPVPAAKAGTSGATARRPARDGESRPTTAIPRKPSASRQAPAPARRPGRYDDRPPYDQEAEQPTTATRRPTPADRYRPGDDRYGRAEPRRPGRDEQGRPSRRAGTPAPGEPDPDARRREARRDGAHRPGGDPRRGTPRETGRPARETRSIPPGYPDVPPAYPAVAYGAADQRPDGTGHDGTGYDGTGYDRDHDRGDRARPDERYAPTPADGRHPRDLVDESHGQHPGYPATPPPQGEYDGYDEYDQYDGEEYDAAGGDDPGAETRRWRGWRRPDWDYDGEPEPEPSEDMMHTMAIDMRGYLDDTGSFRMP